MKKQIALLFLFIPIIGFAQSEISQKNSKEITELRLIKYLISEINVSGASAEIGDLEVFTADVSGDLSCAYFSSRDTNYFVLAFYNDKWNQYGTTYQEYSFKTMELNTALDFLRVTENVFSSYASGSNDKNLLEKDQYLIAQRAGLKIFINESKQLFIYWPQQDLMANWKILNLRRAMRRLEKAVE